MTLSLILCDDHTLFREGLASLIAREPGWRVLAQAADGAEAVRLATDLRPAACPSRPRDRVVGYGAFAFAPGGFHEDPAP